MSTTTERPPARRYLDVLRLVGAGMSNREIAAELCLSPLTVKCYIEDLLERLEARNRAQAAVIAHQRGWLA